MYFMLWQRDIYAYCTHTNKSIQIFHRIDTQRTTPTIHKLNIYILYGRRPPVFFMSVSWQQFPLALYLAPIMVPSVHC